MLSERHTNKKGFTLLACAVCAVALLGTAGLAVDVGRMYITKNEAQSYADAAAVSGQVLRPPTVFPYSPIAHQINCNTPVGSLLGIPTLPAGMDLGNPLGCDATNNFGLQVGRQYDLKWPANPVVADGVIVKLGD